MVHLIEKRTIALETEERVTALEAEERAEALEAEVRAIALEVTKTGIIFVVVAVLGDLCRVVENRDMTINRENLRSIFPT